MSKCILPQGVFVSLLVSVHCVCCYRDLERIEAPVYSVKAHAEIVNTLDGCGGLGIGGGAPELVTGSRDGESIPHTCTECWNFEANVLGLYS